MRHNLAERFFTAEQDIDLKSAVRGLHGLSSQELHKLLRDSENFTISYNSEEGVSVKIDVEILAELLPVHLIAVLIEHERNESLFMYMLSGIRLLSSLYELAPRHAKLEQVLLDNVKMLDRLIDLVFHLLIVLGGYKKETEYSSIVHLLHSALVASSLCLLTECISPQWDEIAHVLLMHPKVDLFMDVSFGAVHIAIGFLEIKLSAYIQLCSHSVLKAEQIINYLCSQCEASLQFLQSLCKQKNLRERILRNKELCGKGGILFLAQAIMKLSVTPHIEKCSAVVASVSRLKAKMLSLLLHLCEAESYLDDVASIPGSLDMAKSIALEVLNLLTTGMSKDPKRLTASSEGHHPTGLLQLNAMRLTDILTDDSNFRSYITNCFTEVLATVFLLPHGEFLSCWCSSDLPEREEDATLENDSFAAAGWVLNICSISNQQFTEKLGYKYKLVPSTMPQSSYAHQRTSLFVKIIANLHCFIPNICEEQERNLFLHKFLGYLRTDKEQQSSGYGFTSDSEKAASVCRNLRSLLSHAESLIPNALNEDDVQLLRIFVDQIRSLITPVESEENQIQTQENRFENSTSWDKFSRLHIGENHQEAQSTGGCSSHLLRREDIKTSNRIANLEGMSDSSAFQDIEQFYVRSKNIDQCGDIRMQARREDTGKLNASAPGGTMEMDEDVRNAEASGSDTSSTRGKNFVDQINSNCPRPSELIQERCAGVQDDEKVEAVRCEEKQRRKRKRTIMNDEQISIIEKALLDEPDMQRNAASIQSWAEKLCLYGSEVTCAQLKNWLNNRKAKLARAAKEARATPDTDSKHAGRGEGPSCGSPESPGEDVHGGPHSRSQANAGGSLNITIAKLIETGPAKFVQCEPGQYVMLVDREGLEIGKGEVRQVHGYWFTTRLEEAETCLVDITDLKVEKQRRLPYPSEANGSTFDEAERKFGAIKVMWDSDKMFMLQHQ